MRSILVILGHPLADFGCCHADNGVGCGIVGGIASENLNADGPFLYVFGVSCKGMLDHEAQEVWQPLAVAEIGACKQTPELFFDRLLFCRACAVLARRSFSHT